jgi:hypothetical protein
MMGVLTPQRRFPVGTRVAGLTTPDGKEATAEFRESGLGSVLAARFVPPTEMDSSKSLVVDALSNCTGSVSGYTPVVPRDSVVENARSFHPVYAGLERLVFTALMAWDPSVKQPVDFGGQAVDILTFHLCLLFFYLDRRVCRAVSGRDIALNPTAAGATRPDHVVAYYGLHEGLKGCFQTASFREFSSHFEKYKEKPYEEMAREAVDSVCRLPLDEKDCSGPHKRLGDFLARYLCMAVYRLETRLPGVTGNGKVTGRVSWEETVERVKVVLENLHDSRSLFERRLMTAHPWTESTLQLTRKAFRAKTKRSLELEETSRKFMGQPGPSPSIRGPQRVKSPADCHLPYLMSSPFLLDQLAFFDKDHSRLAATDSTGILPWYVCAIKHAKKSTVVLLSGSEWSSMDKAEKKPYRQIHPSPVSGDLGRALPIETVLEAYALYRECRDAVKEDSAKASKRRKKETDSVQKKTRKKKAVKEDEQEEEEEEEEERGKKAVQSKRDEKEEPFSSQISLGLSQAQDMEEAIALSQPVKAGSAGALGKKEQLEIKFPRSGSDRTANLRLELLSRIDKYRAWSLDHLTGTNARTAVYVVAAVVALFCQPKSNEQLKSFRKALTAALREYAVILLCSSATRSLSDHSSVSSDASSDSKKRKSAHDSEQPNQMHGPQVRKRLQIALQEYGLENHACFVEPLLHSVCAINCPVVVTQNSAKRLSLYYSDVEFDGRFSPALDFSSVRELPVVLPQPSPAVSALVLPFPDRCLPRSTFLNVIEKPGSGLLDPEAVASSSSSSSSASSASSSSAPVPLSKKTHRFGFNSTNLWGYQLAANNNAQLRLLPVSKAEYETWADDYQLQEYKLLDWVGRRSGCRVLVSTRKSTLPPTDFELDLVDRQMDEPFVSHEELFTSFLLILAMTGNVDQAHWNLQWRMRDPVKRVSSSARYRDLFHKKQEKFFLLHRNRVPQSLDSFIQHASESKEPITYEQIQAAIKDVDPDQHSKIDPELLFSVAVSIIAKGRTLLTSSADARREASRLVEAEQLSHLLSERIAVYLSSNAVVESLYLHMTGSQEAKGVARDTEKVLGVASGKVNVPPVVSILISLRRCVEEDLRAVPSVHHHIRVLRPEFIIRARSAVAERGLNPEHGDHKQTAEQIVHGLVQGLFSAASGPSASDAQRLAKCLYNCIVASFDDDKDSPDLKKLQANTLPRSRLDAYIVAAKRAVA